MSATSGGIASSSCCCASVLCVMMWASSCASCLRSALRRSCVISSVSLRMSSFSSAFVTANTGKVDLSSAFPLTAAGDETDVGDETFADSAIGTRVTAELSASLSQIDCASTAKVSTECGYSNSSNLSARALDADWKSMRESHCDSSLRSRNSSDPFASVKTCEGDDSAGVTSIVRVCSVFKSMQRSELASESAIRASKSTARPWKLAPNRSRIGNCRLDSARGR